MKQYPKIINEDDKLTLLAIEFGIPYTIKTVTEGDIDDGDVGTYYDVDYIDFDMSDDELEEIVHDAWRHARSFVSRHLRNGTMKEIIKPAMR